MTPAPATRDLIAGVSGVRGTVGMGLTPEIMTRLAASHGALLLARSAGERRVVVARDSRTSGPMFRDAAVAGLLSVGCDVVDLGLCPTPTALLAVDLLSAAGGVVISASHNPVEWNAAKLVSGRGLFLTGEEGRAMLALFEAGGPPRVGWAEIGRVMPERDFVAPHVERILAAPEVDAQAIRGRSFQLVVDGCSGVGGLLILPLLERLGCQVDALDVDPTGRFRRDPEPVPASLGELCSRVRRTGADLGLALDPDGDRLALVTASGEPVGEDVTLALAVARVLSFRRSPVVTNLSSSRIVQDVAGAAGCELVRTPVGEIHVAERIVELGSAIGGEGNGGVIYPAVHPTRDAGSAAALVLSLLAARSVGLAEAVGELPRYAMIKEVVPIEDGARAIDREAVRALFPPAVIDLRDGIRLDWPEERAWVHVRLSGTEPVARVIAEAPGSEHARALVARAKTALAADRPRAAASI